MMKSITTAIFTFAGVSFLAFTGCEKPTQADADNNGETSTPNFEADVLAAANAYLTYPMATADAGVAPAACASMPPPPTAKLSKSDEEDSHGRKIYYLFAKDDADYNLGKGEAPVDQVIVKESWVAEPTDEPQNNWVRHESGHQVAPVAWKDKQAYVAKEKGPLFLMLKYAADAPGTDNGWVYATTSPDGSKVNEVGKLQNCMECHQDAPRDRLFGLQ